MVTAAAVGSVNNNCGWGRDGTIRNIGTQLVYPNKNEDDDDPVLMMLIMTVMAMLASDGSSLRYCFSCPCWTGRRSPPMAWYGRCCCVGVDGVVDD